MQALNYQGGLHFFYLIYLLLLTFHPKQLLHLNPISGNYFLSSSCYYDRRCSFLDVKHDSFADNFTKIIRPAFFCIRFRNDASACSFAGLSGSLIRKFASLKSATSKITHAGFDRLGTIRFKNMTLAKRAEDRNIVADLNVVLGSEIDVNDLIASEHFVSVAAENQPARCFS